MKEKLIIITGASSGIGEATAKKLSFSKNKIILISRDIKKMNFHYPQITQQDYQKH
ncbi:MAG: hypothetical protein DRP06_00080 [Candidatus Aenigmatarchaeota archaeon]|nr:MAG: hypothetical protein DRP06_00080 [Candidatus Aenigmarchaeota archaeon]